MILSQISHLDCIAFLVFLAPQLLIQIGLLPILTWLVPAIPHLALVIPYQFIRERFFVPHEHRTPFVKKATPFQDVVIRFVRYAFANMPAFLGRVFFSKAVSLPFLRFRMLRHGIVTSPIRWTEIKRPNFRGVWIVYNQQEQPDIIVYYCHGGGFSMGGSFFYMEFLLAWVSLLHDAGYRNPALFSLEYTLVPDATYPTQLQETLAGYEYVLSLAQSSTRIVVGGDSAGATLILSFLLYMTGHTELRHQRPGLAIMISPWVTIVSRNNRDTASDYLNRSSLELYGRQYIGSKVAANDPLVSPGYCKDVKKWADASPVKGWYFLYGSDEVLASETMELVGLLKSTGKEVDTWVDQGGIHAWPVASLYLGATREERLAGLNSIVGAIKEKIP
ncbi:alpha/beta-hydrolase [Cucurbitaria berberidis CBS 394.84]|uniref:Alpha/beta-hydrolase n=1 Tax=Cucurbitaria berberidis CBS 394.84 TaxID=1168544 RepID=A0A9P4LAN0_9PLEO|nr:alpha/beta-hydrolase [Cucurbitaria berberidis CBS 394.84]KAF1847537.1 alpha/beta-hydrolase [Cucurbitaria berberidis CBS 394.84]